MSAIHFDHVAGVSAAALSNDFLVTAPAPRAEDRFRRNVRASVQYIEAWLGSPDAAHGYGDLDDAAGDISRAHIWQWVTHAAALNSGKLPTTDWLRQVLDDELKAVRVEVGDRRFRSGRFGEASDLLFDVATSEPLREFFTAPASEYL